MLGDAKEYLEISQYIVTIAVPICTAIWFLRKIRKQKVEEVTRYIARKWTNEGAIDSDEDIIISLEVDNHHGDLIGQLETNKRIHPLPFDAHLDVGFLKTKMHVSELVQRESIPVAEVILYLKGNKNRLEWKLVGENGIDILPKTTTLWPF